MRGISVSRTGVRGRSPRRKKKTQDRHLAVALSCVLFHCFRRERERALSQKDRPAVPLYALRREIKNAKRVKKSAQTGSIVRRTP